MMMIILVSFLLGKLPQLQLQFAGRIHQHYSVSVAVSDDFSPSRIALIALPCTTLKYLCKCVSPLKKWEKVGEICVAD